MKPSGDRAFTLLELLTVLAVISILASLLWSAVGNVREMAKGVQCLSHLRQLGIAAQLYWGEHDQLAFPYLAAQSERGQIYWFGWLETEREGHRRFDLERGSLWPYLQGRGIERCSAFDYRHPRYKRKAQGASWGFGYNLHLSSSGAYLPTPETKGVPISGIRQPAQIALFADAAQINDFQPPASTANPMVEEFYYVNDGGPQYANGHFRHRRRANLVFVDGHAAALGWAPGSRDRRLPEWHIARVPRENLIP